jgi:hypothetical protein
VTIPLAIGLAVIAAGLALRMYLGRPAEDRLAPDEEISIADLHRPLARPSFLACPPGYGAAADVESPIFSMPWGQLREYWKEIAEVAAITVVSEFEHRRAVYIQHSPMFRFPDIVTVEFVALGPERSSVAVYSRSAMADTISRRTVSASNVGYSNYKRWPSRRYQATGDGIRGGQDLSQIDPYSLPMREVTQS